MTEYQLKPKHIKIIGAIIVVLIVGTIGQLAIQGGYHPAKASKPIQTVAAAPSAERQIADKIQVSNSIIKKVSDGTYRYFFNVKNTSDKPFNGNVEIDAWTPDKGSYAPYFLHDLSIDPGLQKSGYFDAQGLLNQGGYTFTYSVNIGADTAKYESNQAFTTSVEDDSAL